MWDDLRYRLRALLRHDTVERELEEELQYHMERQAAIYRGRGLSPEEALRHARLAFGGVDSAKEACREARGLSLLEAVSRDFRYALRQCRKNPGFAAVAVATLAIAIGANTAVFSFVRAIVIEKLPVAAAGRLVTVGQRLEEFHRDGSETGFSYSFYQELRSRKTDFEDVLAVFAQETKLIDSGDAIPVRMELVSGNYFSMLGIRPAAGRLLDQRDDAAEGGPGVCVISHRLWQERFGAAAGAVGRRIVVGGVPLEIVGVSEPGFAGASLHQPADLQAPSAMAEQFLGSARDRMGWARLLARLKPGVSREQARARLDAVGRELQSRSGQPPGARDSFLLADGSQGIGRTKAELQKPIALLLLLVGILLLVACANLSALLLTRSVERAREMGIRLALGASRAAVIRHFLSEGLALAIAGGAAGWLLAQLLVRMLLSLLGTEGEGLAPHVRPDLAIFGYSVSVTLAAGILVSLLPAWRSARSDPLPGIQGGGAGWRRPLATRTLVAAQIALSVVLIFGAGLFTQTLRNLRLGTRAFDAGQVVLAEVDLSGTTHGRNPEPFFDEVLRGARELPGVRSASLTQIRILSGSMMSIVLRIPGYRPSNGVPAATYFNTVSAGYFATLQIPIVAGRDFAPGDRGDGGGAVIVNQEFARQFLSGGALGKQFTYASGRKVRVVGVVADARYRGLREGIQPIMYLPVTQWHFPDDLHLQVRTTQDSTAAIARVRALVHRLDRSLSLGQIGAMETQIDQTLTRERLLAVLSTILGAIAMVLVSIGVYGVVSFSVARRVSEIGVRLAMGSPSTDILLLFLREAVGTTLIGVACGIPLAVASGRLASSLLYGLKPGDALTAVTAGAVLMLAAVAAALIPAWRAAQLDASASLRCE